MWHAFCIINKQLLNLFGFFITHPQLRVFRSVSNTRIMKIVNQMIDTAKDLISLADEGDAACEDDVRHVFFGVVRDCAYRILTEAERESDSNPLGCSNKKDGH